MIPLAGGAVNPGVDANDDAIDARTDCVHARYCFGGTCVPTLPSRAPCTYADQRTSSYCADAP